MTLLICPKAPKVPGAGATQRDVATYVVKLKSTRDACELKVNAISRIVLMQAKTVKEFNDKQAIEAAAAPPL